jgi:hypothetical protein
MNVAELGAPQCGQVAEAPIFGGAKKPIRGTIFDLIGQGTGISRRWEEVRDGFLKPRQDIGRGC